MAFALAEVEFLLTPDTGFEKDGVKRTLLSGFSAQELEHKEPQT